MCLICHWTVENVYLANDDNAVLPLLSQEVKLILHTCLVRRPDVSPEGEVRANRRLCLTNFIHGHQGKLRCGTWFVGV